MKIASMLFFFCGLALLGSRAEAGEGFVLNMFHFNFQYVAGNDKASRMGVERGLEPLLDVFLAHPDWKADFELQSAYLVYLDEHFPRVFEKLRKLARSGQAEMVSFHYADQLLLAFPALDSERSLQLTKEIFAKYEIPLSGVIFTQEAQFGEGVCRLGKKWGYRVAVMTPGSYHWFQADNGYPYYSCRGLEVLKAEDPDIPPEKTAEYVEPKSGIRAKWYFLGDGELVVTGGVSPYFSAFFRAKPKLIKKLEDDFTRHQQNGYRIATIGEYVAALQSHQVAPRPLKPMLDAAWRPWDDQGMFTWMGKYVFPYEDDYGIRTENWRARSWLLAAEKAGLPWEKLRHAWQNQLEAEVSDSTGWYPLPVELRFSREKSRLVIDEIKRLCPTCRPEEMKLELEPIPVGNFPLAPKIVGALAGELKYFRVKGQENLFALEAKFRAGRDSKLAFPFTGPAIIYSPALMEDELVAIPLAEIRHPLHYVGLTNGLIALDRDLWLIRDNRAGAVGCGIDPANREIHFRVTGALGREIFFRVYICKGPEKEALEFANQLNQT